MPLLLALLTGGLGVTFYQAYKDRRNRIAAQPIEQRKVELDATDRAIENIMEVQTGIVEENRRLNDRIAETERRVRESQQESERRFQEVQDLLDEALRKIDAYRRYIMKVRRELAGQNIQMPEPDEKDRGIIHL